jgi:probable phosphoglycerate mutase
VSREVDKEQNDERDWPQIRFQPDALATEILLVRHGESAPARSSRPFPLLEGQGDPELSPLGEAQAVALGTALGREQIAALYVTSLRRTHQTAAPLTEELGCEPRVEKDLREVFLGKWEGGAFRRHVTESHPLALEMARRERWDVVPGAESNEAFAERLRSGIGRIAAAHRGEKVAAFTHGGSIGMILSLASGARPFSFLAVDNASISRLVVSGDNWVVRGFNDTAHLRGISESL